MSGDEDHPAQSSSDIFRELRELSLGNLGKDQVDLYPWAPFVENDELRDIMMFIAAEYEPPSAEYPDRFEDTKLGQRLLRREASHAIADAVANNDKTSASYLAGMKDNENDVSGLRTLQKMENWLLDSGAAKIVYIAGHMGTGKTDFAHLMLQVVMHRREFNGEEVEVRTNIESSEFRTINEYDALREWMSTGSADDNKWFIFDEASSELSGYSHDRAKVEQLMSSLVKKMRKNGVNMIIIGHTGMDLHADLRRLADYVKKQSTKVADIYASVHKGEGTGHLLRLDQVPPTEIDYDTEDEAEWDWGDALDDDPAEGISEDEFRDWRDRRMARLYYDFDDLTQPDIANTFDVGSSTVARACRRFKDEF